MKQLRGIASYLLLAAALTRLLACQAVPRETVEASESWNQLTIYEGSWTDTNGMEARGKFADGEGTPYLIANVVEWDGWPKMKEFTTRASKDWVLVGSDGSGIPAKSMTGGTSSGDGNLRAIILVPERPIPNAESRVTYQLIPKNQVEGARWGVLPQVRIHR